MTRTTVILLALFTLALVFSADAGAAVVTGNFTGTVTEIHEDLAGLAPAIGSVSDCEHQGAS